VLQLAFMVRPPTVAGRFYPSDAQELARQIDHYCSGGTQGPPARGCVVPHAGYMYSGQVAGAVYSSLRIPARCILLGPRHFPQGQPMAILSEGSWQTPLGAVEIDSPLASALAQACHHLREDVVAHEREHSLEVQLPFLQRIAKDFRFVPVVLGTDRYPVLEDLGRAVAQVVAAQTDPVLVIASSDMNHYENETITRTKDQKAIGRILALDPRGLYDVVRSEGITMCGYAATVAALVAVLRLGAKEAELIRYGTSGDISGERDQVVGYAGIIIR
jgi:AmmeMemoRadiSam system protein B